MADAFRVLAFSPVKLRALALLSVEPVTSIRARPEGDTVVPILGERAHFEGKHSQEGLGPCEEHRPICRIGHFTD